MEHIEIFFDRIKNLNFWQRLFGWGTIKSLINSTYEAIKGIKSNLDSANHELGEVKNQLLTAANDNSNLKDQVANSNVTIGKYETRIDQLTQQLAEANRKITKYESTEESRKFEADKRIDQLTQSKLDFDAERSRLSDDRIKEKEAQMEQMKKQWANHEAGVKQAIQMICQKHLIEYVENFPLKGNPDNSILICDEYVIFDAKSPANDNLENFPKYIRAQAESVSKYTKQTSVKKDLYLVVPTNTFEVLSQHVYNMGEYNVYIITKDSLEPIMFSYKKIETYEFAEQLSPEDRDQICRLIGKFVHTTKRKIQLDQFMNGQFLELLFKASNDIPDEMIEAVTKYEAAEKLNPPTDKRSKEMMTSELERRQSILETEIGSRGITKVKEVGEFAEAS